MPLAVAAIASPTGTPLSASRDRVGECPVWSVPEQALYWVDIEGRHIHRFDWASQTQQTWHTPERVGCIALTGQSLQAGSGLRGRVVAAMEYGIYEVHLGQAPQVNATLIAKLPFDPIRSFEPVALLGTAANVLLVHPSIPAKNVSAFAAAAKARPGAINYSSSGNGGTGHLAMEMFKQAAMERILDRLLLQAVSRLLTKAQKRP